MSDFCARGRELDTDANNPSGESQRSFRLSDDVLVCALELLGLSDLRSAAGVSRQFYSAAWRSGLYIHIKNRNVLAPRDPIIVEREADSWNALVDQALRKKLRVAFTLHGRRAMGAQISDTLPLLRKLLCVMTKALPILVSLCIAVEAGTYPELCTALRRPAPFLWCLSIRSFSSEDVALGPIRPSDALFSGNAPLLRDLGLELVSLGPAPIPAFSNVVRFSTWRIGEQRVSLVHHFPGLRHLLLVPDGDDREVPPPQVDVSGIRLRSLAVHDTPTSRFNPLVVRTLRVHCPPPFQCIIEKNGHLAWHAPLGWRAGDSGGGAIEMHVTSIHGFKNYSYAPEDGAWRRSYLSKSLLGSSAPYGLTGVPPRLAYLRMHHSALWDLMRCDVDFAALRRLRVDVVCEDTADTSQPMTVHFEAARRRRSKVDFQLRCPGLATVALLWHARAPEGPVMLDSECVLILGSALVTDAKPVLALGDVDRERPLVLSDASEDVSAALTNVFAAVRRVPCAFGVLLDHFDGDGWNDNAAVVEEKYLSQSLPW